MKNIMTDQDVADLTGYKLSTFRNKIYTEKRTLPPMRKAGRKIYFLRSEVEDWIINLPVTNK